MTSRAVAEERPPREAVEWCARQVLEVVPRAMRLLREEMRQEAGPGLSVPQLRVLAYVGRSRGCALSEAARHLGVADPTASVMVGRLVQRGLVSRGGTAGRRRMALELTARGAGLLERARAHARARVAERLGALGAPELAVVARGLEVLDRALGGPPRARARAGVRPKVRA